MSRNLDALLSSYSTFVSPEEFAASASSEAPGTVWTTTFLSPATPSVATTGLFLC